MEEMLLKMARQLDDIDQASLEALWEKYAEIVNAFEPTKHWEEAVLVLSFIQAKHWKNQLFNTQWAMRSKASRHIDLNTDGASAEFSGMLSDFIKQSKPKEKAVVLSFSLEDDEQEDK